MTPKQKHNYEGSGRRVRPTTAKLSKAQRETLEVLARPNNPNGKHSPTLNCSFFFWGDGQPISGVCAPRKGTFDALLVRGLVELRYEGFWHTYTITETGRAALETTQPKAEPRYTLEERFYWVTTYMSWARESGLKGDLDQRRTWLYAAQNAANGYICVAEMGRAVTLAEYNEWEYPGWTALMERIAAETAVRS